LEIYLLHFILAFLLSSDRTLTIFRVAWEVECCEDGPREIQGHYAFDCQTEQWHGCVGERICFEVTLAYFVGGNAVRRGD
jgi:hypothetical protein